MRGKMRPLAGRVLNALFYFLALLAIVSKRLQQLPTGHFLTGFFLTR